MVAVSELHFAANRYLGGSYAEVMASVALNSEDDMHPNLSHQKYLQQSVSPEAKPGVVATKRAGLVGLWLRAILRNWRQRKMIAVLEAMDDRLLRDIGVHRGDIARVVAGFDDRELRMTPLAEAERPIDTEEEAFRKAA